MVDAGVDGLETARLSLRRFTLADEALLMRLNSDANVMRHLGGPMSPETSRENLENRILAYYAVNPGLGVWATLLRSTGQCIGFHLLNQVMGEDFIQIGYRLFEAHWGQGYATEMSMALLRYGFDDLGLPLITANAALDNIGSQNVLLKCGLRRHGSRTLTHPMYAGFGEVAHFERGRDQWLSEFTAG